MGVSVPGPMIMNIPEFSRSADIYLKRSTIACMGPLLVALVIICAYAPFQKRFEAFLSTRFESFAVDVLVVVPMALPMILAIASMIPMSNWIERKSGIACRNCGKALANHKAIVIASKSCPYCGRRVLEEAQ